MCEYVSIRVCACSCMQIVRRKTFCFPLPPPIPGEDCSVPRQTSVNTDIIDAQDSRSFGDCNGWVLVVTSDGINVEGLRRGHL